jgi:hypothetical protein
MAAIPAALDVGVVADEAFVVGLAALLSSLLAVPSCGRALRLWALDVGLAAGSVGRVEAMMARATGAELRWLALPVAREVEEERAMLGAGGRGREPRREPPLNVVRAGAGEGGEGDGEGDRGGPHSLDGPSLGRLPRAPPACLPACGTASGWALLGSAGRVWSA